MARCSAMPSGVERTPSASCSGYHQIAESEQFFSAGLMVRNESAPVEYPRSDVVYFDEDRNRAPWRPTWLM